MEIVENTKIKSKRGRKATGKKTRTLGVSIPLWLYDCLKQDVDKRRSNEGNTIFTPQQFLREILVEYYRNRDQLSLFSQEKTLQ